MYQPRMIVVKHNSSTQKGGLQLIIATDRSIYVECEIKSYWYVAGYMLHVILLDDLHFIHHQKNCTTL